MRILHAPKNIAGQPYVLSRAQRKLGHNSDVLTLTKSKYGYFADICLDFAKLDSYDRFKMFIATIVRTIRKYDVIHLHYEPALVTSTGIPQLFYQADLALLKIFRKKVLVHFRGCDIRMSQRDIKRNKYSPCGNCSINCGSDTEKQEKLNMVRKYSNMILLSTPDLLVDVPDGILVPRVIDIDENMCNSEKQSCNQIPLVIHAPSDRKIKATDVIIQAVETLRKMGTLFDFRLVENMSFEEAQNLYRKADVIIDQLQVGWYGNVAIEAMANRKPVLSYIRDDLLSFRKNLPIVSCTKDNLAEKLKPLLDNPDERKRIGQAGYEYVQEVHNSKKIAEFLIKLYSKGTARETKQ